MRPSGDAFASAGRMSKPPQLSGWIMGVSIGPGCTEFTRMPLAPQLERGDLGQSAHRELAR